MNATVSDIIVDQEICPGPGAISLVDTRIMNQLTYTVSCAKFTALGFRFTGDLPQRVAESVALLKKARSC